MNIIHFQPELRPALSVVLGAKDDREFRATLEEMDHILTTTGIEQRFITERINELGVLTPKQIQRHGKTFRLALRYNILLGLTGESYRQLSLRVAASQLFQWLTGN